MLDFVKEFCTNALPVLLVMIVGYIPAVHYIERKYDRGRTILSLEIKQYTEEIKKLRQALQVSADREAQKNSTIVQLRREIQAATNDDVAEYIIEKLEEMGAMK